MDPADEKTKLKDHFYEEKEEEEEEECEETSAVHIKDAIDGAKCGFGTVLYCIAPFMFLCFQGAEIIVLSIVGLMVKCEWHLGPFWVSALQMNVIASQAFASFVFSTLGDRFGRKPVCLVGAIGVTVTGVLCGLAEKYWQLFLLRVLLGIFLGIGVAPAMALCGEIPPTRCRALALAENSLAFGIGGSITSGIAYFVIESYGWRGLLIATAIVYSPTIPCFYFARESPKFDAQKRNFERAEETIRILYKLNRTPTEDIKLKREDLVEEENLDCPTIYRTLKNTDNLRNFAVACALAFFSYFSYSTTTNSTPRLLNEGYCSGTPVNSEERCTFDKAVLFDLGVVSLSEPLAVLIAVVMVDIVGRRKTFITSAILSLCIIAPLYFCGVHDHVLIVLTMTKFTVATVILGSDMLTAEYFPTSIRSFAIAIVITCGQFGSISGIFNAQYAYNVSPRLLLALLQVSVMCAGVCFVLLKRETMGTQLE